jgi:hypothetical protein
VDVLKTLLVGVLASVVMLPAQCGGVVEGKRVEAALWPYSAKAEPDAGKIRAVRCDASGRYRGRIVYFCLVRHPDVISVWCASMVDGKLFTQDQGIPCPRPGGPNRNPLPAPG